MIDVLGDRVSGVVKIEDMIIQSTLPWYGHVMHGDINSQIREVMEVEITWKRKKVQPRKSWKECVKKDLERYGLKREDEKNKKIYQASMIWIIIANIRMEQSTCSIFKIKLSICGTSIISRIGNECGYQCCKQFAKFYKKLGKSTIVVGFKFNKRMR